MLNEVIALYFGCESVLFLAVEYLVSDAVGRDGRYVGYNIGSCYLFGLVIK